MSRFIWQVAISEIFVALLLLFLMLELFAFPFGPLRVDDLGHYDSYEQHQYHKDIHTCSFAQIVAPGGENG